MTYGPYPAKVVDLHDGDTVHLIVDLGFGFMLNPYNIYGHPVVSCRVFGINAPELSTPEGKTALAFAETLLKPGDMVSVVSHGWDKYGGRFDGEITMADGRSFGQVMLDTGHAVSLAA